MAIGVRAEALERRKETTDDQRTPSLAEVLGTLFDAMFLDHLTSDVEHLVRLNQLLSTGHLHQDPMAGCEQIRPLRPLLIRPSVDLSQVAEEHQQDMPYLIHYFISSLGREAGSCSDLMSYLLFTSQYTRALIDIGYNDADRQIDEIEDFFYCTPD